jgi:hypothetical protein
MGDERQEVVRHGYDESGACYLAARPLDGHDAALLTEFDAHLPPGARILDVEPGPARTNSLPGNAENTCELTARWRRPHGSSLSRQAPRGRARTP